MSEEAKEQEQATEGAETATEEATDLQAEVQKWKAHAREQEKRAKANKAAADELQKLKDEKLSETERLTKRAENAERQLEQLEAEKERFEAATRISTETGLSVEKILMLNGRNAEELAEQAKAFAATSSAFAPTHDKGDGGHAHSKTPAEEFGEWFRKNLS